VGVHEEVEEGVYVELELLAGLAHEGRGLEALAVEEARALEGPAEVGRDAVGLQHLLEVLDLSLSSKTIALHQKLSL
jgi:hypothetical protein